MRGLPLFSAAVALMTSATGSAGERSLADPDDREQVARGAGIYTEACASCHGERLEGQDNWRTANPDGTYPAPPHDGDGHTWHHSDELLFNYTKLGGEEALKGVPGVRSAMPGFGDVLSDQEIWHVLAFIKSNWPEPALRYQRSVSEQ